MSDTLENSKKQAVFTLAQALELTDSLAAGSEEPIWARDIRRAGIVAWRTLAPATQKDEDWRRTAPQAIIPAICPEIKDLAYVATSIELPSEYAEGTEEQRQSLICLSMDEALGTCPELEKIFFLDERQQKEQYVALNAALRNGGSYTRVAPGIKPSAPVRLKHFADSQEGGYFFPHSVVYSGADSSLDMVEHFTSGREPLKSDAVIELNLQEGAHLHYTLILDWGAQTDTVARIHAHLSRNANLHLVIVALGGRTSKVFVTSDINGSGANSEIYGMVYADAWQHFDVDTLQRHHTPGACSNVLFNSAVNDSAYTIFDGNIEVDAQAQHTDAYQRNNNLLLSPAAKASAMPKLEIIANDVRCTHGAGFSSFDEEQLFYLLSRGMDKATAQRLVLAGFFQTIIDKIENPQVIEHITSLTAARLDASLKRSGAGA